MNVITFNAAYSFYPVATFEKRSNFICLSDKHSLRPRQASALRKYENRGWSEQRGAYHVLLRKFGSPFFFESTRWVGDKKCWSIPLDTRDIVKLAKRLGDQEIDYHLKNDPFSLNGWTMRYDTTESKLTMEYKKFYSNVVKHDYIIPNECHYKFQMIERWFEKLRLLDGAIISSPNDEELKRRKFAHRIISTGHST